MNHHKRKTSWEKGLYIMDKNKVGDPRTLIIRNRQDESIVIYGLIIIANNKVQRLYIVRMLQMNKCVETQPAIDI